ncbi:MAG: hypothetical protein ACRCZF_13950, partial [Gemmataceae bacterium]
MRLLFDEVLKWGDQLVFKGTKDESLPPGVLAALDDYLAESQPKLLVVTPIRDEREKDEKVPARSVVLLECFNPPENTDPILQRLEIVNKHAAPALYNAAEMKKIPLKPLWWPVLKVQEGLGGRARFITILAIVGLLALTAAMILVPSPLKMEAKGQLEPVEIGSIYAPAEGQLMQINFMPGDKIDAGAAIVDLYSDQMAEKIRNYEGKLAENNATVSSTGNLDRSKVPGEALSNLEIQLAQAKAGIFSTQSAMQDTVKLFNLDMNRVGYFSAKAPKLDPTKVQTGAKWTMLNADNRDQLLRRTVKPTEPILRVGYVEGIWHVTLKIPQRNIGHIMKAFDDAKLHKVEGTRKYLDVDLLLTNDSDTKRSGRLYMDQIAPEAVPNRDDHNESEPVVLAKCAINLSDFATERQIPRSLFVTGQEVHVRIRCGEYPLGYSLFHGVYEWFYEKVIFFF